MAIPAPAGLVITPEQDLVIPAMMSAQLETALANGNRAWRDYRPPLVSVTPQMVASGAAATTEIILPIEPSTDGIAYLTRWAVQFSAACNATWQVLEWDAGAWNAIDGAVEVVGGAGVHRWNTNSTNISATSTLLKYVLAPSVGTALIDMILTYPDPGVPVAGITPSGFRPYDDGLLSAAGAPINTEHIRRAWRNPTILQRDRKPMILSVAQVWTDPAALRCTGAATGSVILSPGPIRMQGQEGSHTLGIHGWAKVTAGGTAGLIRVRQIATKSGKVMAETSFAADSAWHDTTLAVEVEGSGLSASITLQVEVGWTAGNFTTLRSLGAFWRPA